MDFENARWVKLYCQDTGTWLRLGWQGRTVALHLLRAVNASGVLSDLGDEPELILAELLRLPVDVVTPGVASLLRTETITLANGILVWKQFVEAQKSRKSEAQRKAEYRAKHRAKAIQEQGGNAHQSRLRQVAQPSRLVACGVALCAGFNGVRWASGCKALITLRLRAGWRLLALGFAVALDAA